MISSIYHYIMIIFWIVSGLKLICQIAQHFVECNGLCVELMFKVTAFCLQGNGFKRQSMETLDSSVLEDTSFIDENDLTMEVSVLEEQVANTLAVCWLYIAFVFQLMLLFIQICLNAVVLQVFYFICMLAFCNLPLLLARF